MSGTAALMPPGGGLEVTMARLEDQLGYYEAKSSWNQKRYRWIKATEIIAAALIPFIAGFGDHIPHAAWITGGLGVLITVLEGFLQLYKFQDTWTSYRATAEALKHEKFLYLAGASPYNVPNASVVLAERVESLLSQENVKWISAQQQGDKKKMDGNGDPGKH